MYIFLSKQYIIVAQTGYTRQKTGQFSLNTTRFSQTQLFTCLQQTTFTFSSVIVFILSSSLSFFSSSLKYFSSLSASA